MNLEELVRLSGLVLTPGYETYDPSIPMNADGTYPFNGHAIAVYRQPGFNRFEIVPYYTLAKTAMDAICVTWKERMIAAPFGTVVNREEVYSLMSDISDLSDLMVLGRDEK